MFGSNDYFRAKKIRDNADFKNNPRGFIKDTYSIKSEPNLILPDTKVSLSKKLQIASLILSHIIKQGPIEISKPDKDRESA